MKFSIKAAALTLAGLGAIAAHAQTPAAAPGATISAPGTTSPAQVPRAGRPHVAPHSAVRKPKTAAVPLGTSDVTIDGNNDHRTIDCQGNTITVNGNGNRLLLRGNCTKLVLNGNENIVHWSGQTPAVSDLGNKNVTGQIN